MMTFGGTGNMTEDFSAKVTIHRSLDRIDAVLLDALRSNGRLRLEDLARRVELSPSSVHERLRRLERTGVIRRWTITVAPEALGLGVLAFVDVRASRPCSQLAEPVGRIGEVEEFHALAGQFSFRLKLRARSTEHLLEIIERLKQIPGIEATETAIVLKTYLEDGPRIVP
jgi:DNA-binding Lrp family transcriptional regulator